jgi:hypothetical protein
MTTPAYESVLAVPAGGDADAGDEPLAQRAARVLLDRAVPPRGEQRPAPCRLDGLEAADRLDQHRLLGQPWPID